MAFKAGSGLADVLRQSLAVTVPLESIDLDDLTFAVSTVNNAEALTDSLEFAGLLHRVWLVPKGAQYRIISGFLRTHIWRNLGRETIATLVLPENTADLALAQLAIMDNLTARPLDAVEEARAVALMQKFSPDDQALRQNLRALNLSENPKHLAKLARLLQLPVVTQNAVAADLIPLAVAEDLAAFDSAVALKFTEIFVAGKVGLNRQREFMRLAYELAKIRDLDLGEVFALDGFAGIWQGGESDQRRKALLLLDWLYATRYPNIAHAREQARQKIATLTPDSRIRLNMPENFENMRHSLSFGFESRDELLELLELCRQMSDNEGLAALFVRQS